MLQGFRFTRRTFQVVIDMKPGDRVSLSEDSTQLGTITEIENRKDFPMPIYKVNWDSGQTIFNGVLISGYSECVLTSVPDAN